MNQPAETPKVLKGSIAPGGSTYFGNVIAEVRRYFVFRYHAGTREMIAREVRQRMGDVPDKVISKALKELKGDGAVTYEKKVWWFLGDR